MLFQKNIVKKYLAGLPKEQTDHAWNQFKSYFLNSEIQTNILQSKEEQFQEGFLRELFVKVLGYTLNPSPDYNLITEQKNETNAKKADGAILLDDKVIGVIELKDHKTQDLSKIENQAFGYKNQHQGTKLVIISNFEKLRLYIENTIDFREWNLFTLNEDDFRELYLCLAWEQVKKGCAIKLKEESVSSEDKITNALYKDYSQFKRVLFADILERNQYTEDNQWATNEKDWQLLLFKKTQKLLDRLLFIFFAEDCGLLQPNSMIKIINLWETLRDADAYVPLYNRIRQYFGYLHEGHQGKPFDVYAYNGGLFKPDEVLDNITISDDLLLTHTRKLSEYDFESDVDVNILGHIFENSLSEIEEVTQQITQGTTPQTSKRKQDGVFYTPQYITKYIVENTVGRLCTEKKAELHIDEAEYYSDHRRQMQTRKRLLDQLHQYRDWLLQITILDPACGSGAFLNAALQFLMAEHRLIDEMEAKVAGSSLVFQDVENSILENNLFGVDINEESVEIAQLALWLRTAKPHRKLNTLSENIKCGNSLISDPAIAGEKAFNWQEQFPKVFEKGGFDVVIGNPPYVRVQQLDYETIDFLKSIYKTALKRIDMSLCFIEKSKELIKSNGIVSFITSNQFLTTEYGQAMRKFLLEDYFLTKCVDFGDLKIFEDAMTYVSIFSFTNIPQKSFDYCRVKEIKDAENGKYDNFHKIVLSDLTEDNWNLQNYSMSKIFQRVFENDKTIEDLGNAWYGIVTGADSVFIFDREDYEKTEIEKDLFLPLLRAQSCGKYYCEKAEKYVLYPYKYEDGETVLLSQDEIENKYPNGWKYFLEHKEELESRKDSRSTFEGRDDWYCLTRFGQKKIFNRDKIVTPGEVKGHKFCIDRSQAGYSGARVFGITIDKEDLSLELLVSDKKLS